VVFSSIIAFLIRKGLSVAELKAKVREAHAKQRRETASQASTSTALASENAPFSTPSFSTKTGPVIGENVRKDSSPVKPLSSILNVPRLFSTPHTATQISALWTAYHVSRSGGTGKGYICASLSIELYEKMATVAGKYPVFVVPVLRVKNDQLEEGEATRAYEFSFLQWCFHGLPPAPSGIEDPFSTSSTVSNNSQISTILFTPLQEYKMRASFATPYLVLTFYTDLASSHGTILMRGEITPATAGPVPGASNVAGSEGRYLLSQEDVQLLAMQVQKVYLWGEDNNEGKDREGERLLKMFHEQPEEFKWEELLKYADLSE